MKHTINQSLKKKTQNLNKIANSENSLIASSGDETGRMQNQKSVKLLNHNKQATRRKDTGELLTTMQTIREDGLKKIRDKTSLSNLGIVILNEKNLTEITKNSGPLTKGNEFQIHYWFLNARFTMPDESHIDIAIPTVFFNYKQVVTNGHISFDLSDVDDASEALEPVHNSKVNELMNNKQFVSYFEDMKIDLAKSIDGTVVLTWTGESLAQIHRHP